MVMKHQILITVFIVGIVGVQLTVSQTKSAPQTSIQENPQTKSDQNVQAMQQERQEPALPKIDLPEFVITGVATFTPPDVEKIQIEDSGIYRSGQLSNKIGDRDQKTLELGERYREKYFQPPKKTFNGKITGSYGTFYSPQFALWIGQKLSTFDYAVDGYYEKTRGFQSFTDRSEGGIGLRGNFVFASESPLINQARLYGQTRYDSEKYRFYGSTNPRATRRISSLGFETNFSSPIKSPILYDASFSFMNTVIEDSSERTRENKVLTGIQFEIPVLGTRLETGVQYSISTFGSSKDNTLSLLEGLLGVPRIWWKDLFISGGVKYSVVKGMVGQDDAKLLPRAAFGFRVFNGHVVSFGYEPEFKFFTLLNRIEMNPFLSTKSDLKLPLTKLSLESSLESDWSQILSSRVSVTYEKVDDIPFYVDSTRSGQWKLKYSGQTNFFRPNLQVFANISPNDYFRIAVLGNFMKNPNTGNRVPYLPEMEASIFYSHKFSFGLGLHPRIEYLHERPISIDSTIKLPGFMLAHFDIEYTGLSPMSVFVNFNNVLNKKYEIWDRYRGLPFTVRAGLSVKW